MLKHFDDFDFVVIEGYKRYFGCTEEDDWMVEDYPVGVIGMFSTDYKRT